MPGRLHSPSRLVDQLNETSELRYLDYSEFPSSQTTDELLSKGHSNQFSSATPFQTEVLDQRFEGSKTFNDGDLT